MDPEIPPESPSICDPDVEPESIETGVIYVFEFGDQILNHELVEVNDGEDRFEGSNNDFQEVAGNSGVFFEYRYHIELPIL